MQRVLTLADSDDGTLDPAHTFKNHLAIIVGFADLVLAEMSEDDPRRRDVLEIHKAAHDALALLPALLDRRR